MFQPTHVRWPFSVRSMLTLSVAGVLLGCSGTDATQDGSPERGGQQGSQSSNATGGATDATRSTTSNGGSSIGFGGASNLGGTLATGGVPATGGQDTQSSLGGSGFGGANAGGNSVGGKSNGGTSAGGKNAGGKNAGGRSSTVTGGVGGSSIAAGGTRAAGGSYAAAGARASGGAPSSGSGGKATGGVVSPAGGSASGTNAKGGSSASATGVAGASSADCPFAGHVTYTLAKASNPSADQQAAYDKITAAMDTAVRYYNCYTNITKTINVSFVPSVATADGNISGSIRFGSTASMNKVTAMHEVSHTVGIGTASNWGSFVSNGTFSGTNANAQLMAIPNRLADTIGADSQHFWPYGLNYESEGQHESDLIGHCQMVVAIRKDLGM